MPVPPLPAPPHARPPLLPPPSGRWLRLIMQIFLRQVRQMSLLDELGQARPSLSHPLPHLKSLSHPPPIAPLRCTSCSNLSPSLAQHTSHLDLSLTRYLPPSPLTLARSLAPTRPTLHFSLSPSLPPIHPPSLPTATSTFHPSSLTLSSPPPSRSPSFPPSSTGLPHLLGQDRHAHLQPNGVSSRMYR